MKSEIKLLYDISDILISRKSVREAIREVLHFITDGLHLKKSFITIVEKSTGEIFIEEAIGLSEHEKKRGTYRPGEGITGRVVENGKPVIIENISKSDIFLDKTKSRSKQERNGTSFIAVPITYKKETIGTLSVDVKNEGAAALEYLVNFLSVTAALLSQAVRLHQSINEENQKLKEENLKLISRMQDTEPASMIGTSGRMQEMYRLINKVAQGMTTVLITGESGVGKELVAAELHQKSPRKDKPFIKFNCAALPANLVESELFGHEKGSFTGAINKRIGRFEQAHGGTVFLDEIGELKPEIQTKLLRVIQEKQIERVGGHRVIDADIRIIAATNRDLMKEVSENRFREDLYYRLNVFPVQVPPLRERKGDIPLLTDYFIKKYSSAIGKTINRISTPAINMLMSYHWPGNVRELESCIERAVILSEEDTIHGFDLPPTLQTIPETHEISKFGLEDHISTVEYELIVEALKQTGGNISKAASNLKISERKLGLRLKRFHINYKTYRQNYEKRSGALV